MEQVLPLWTPKDISSTQMDIFRKFVNQNYNNSSKTLQDYTDHYAWSCEEISTFWEAVWDFLGIRCSKPYTKVIEPNKSMDQIPKWFIGAELNYAENILMPFKDSDHLAIISTGEGRKTIKTSFRELYQQVNVVAREMRALGVQKGDRVVAYISNCTESVVIMLAA